jgi:hypothetical protein
MQGDARLRKIGGRRPTGTAMSPGRRAGLGGTRAASYAARVQFVLPVHGQCHGSRRPEPRGFPAHLPDACELQTGIRRVSDVAYQRHAEFAGGSLPAHTPRPANRFHGRRDAADRGKAFFGESARQAGRGCGIERSTAAWFGASFAGIAGVRNIARFARSGVQRNSSGATSAGGHGEIADQPGTNRAGTYFERNGRAVELKEA